MPELTLTKTRMQSGVWQGVITGAAEQPAIAVTHLGTEIPDVSLSPADAADTWLLQIPIPANVLSDGMQTLLIVDRATGDALNSIALMAGEALGDDLRAEVDLLRAELDMLKRAFRRHCVETS
ncbi:MAG: hypothetical protein WBV62_17930 [Roseobacter sp.]